MPAQKLWVQNIYEKIIPFVEKINGFVPAYINAPQLNLPNYLKSYYAKNKNKLIKLKQKYDPENIFNFRQSIPI